MVATLRNKRKVMKVSHAQQQLHIFPSTSFAPVRVSMVRQLRRKEVLNGNSTGTFIHDIQVVRANVGHPFPMILPSRPEKKIDAVKLTALECAY